MSTKTHPAACPYCGGTTVNQIQPDYLLRHALLNDDGSLTVGSLTAGEVQGVDFDEPAEPALLFCHRCSSTYTQPATVPTHHDETLEVAYPPAVQPGDPAYRGIGVAWTPVPTGPTFTAPHPVTARG